MIYVFDVNTEHCLEKCGTNPAPPLEAFQANHGLNIILKTYDVDPLPGIDAENITAIIEGGEIMGEPHVQSQPELWLHGSVDGGTVNQLTGTRYIERGQSLTYSASLRESSDPASAIVTHIPDTDPLVPVSGEWALELVHELGLDQFSPMVALVEGQIGGSVTIPDRLCDGLYQLPEERMAMVGPFKLRVADPGAFEFKVRS